jgi:hypothetical protein
MSEPRIDMIDPQTQRASKRSRMPSRPWRAVIPSFLLLTFCFGSIALAQSAVVVEWKDERLSVTAEKASLSQVLREVAGKTSIVIRGLDMLQEEVSVSFSRRTLREGLGRLLDQVDHVVTEEVSPEGEWRPAYVLIFRRGAPSVQEGMPIEETMIAAGGTPLEDEPEAQEVIPAGGGGTPLEDERRAQEVIPAGGGTPLEDERRAQEVIPVGGGTPLEDERGLGLRIPVKK